MRLVSQDEGGRPEAASAALLRELGAEPGAPLAFGGVPVDELAARFGTPFFAYDASVLRRRVRAVQRAFGPGVRLLYALKANPCAAVAAVLRAAGTGAEIASLGELEVALRAGHVADGIQFAGPAKRDEELRRAAELGIDCLNLESEGEYDRLCRLVEGGDLRPRVGLRVQLAEAGGGGGALRMAGSASKFGIPEPELLPLAKRILADDLCDLRGLHRYYGTQLFDADAWLVEARRLLVLARGIEEESGSELATLDFGGGFGVATQPGGAEFDLELAGRGLQELLAEEPRRVAYLELGRFLTAPAGIYVCRVLDVKRSGGSPFAMVDGGMHHHAAAAGHGSVLRRPWPMVLAESPFAPPDDADWRVAGPLCTPQDEFLTGGLLSQPRRGSLLVVLASGAYGTSFSPTGFLGHPSALELLVDEGNATVVRERGSEFDPLRGQRLPDEFVP